MVGVDKGESKLRSRVVRAEVRELRRSHEEMLKLLSSRCCSFGKQWKAKKSERLTDPPSPRIMTDSTLLDRISPHLASEEIIESRSSESLATR